MSDYRPTDPAQTKMGACAEMLRERGFAQNDEALIAISRLLDAIAIEPATPPEVLRWAKLSANAIARGRPATSAPQSSRWSWLRHALVLSKGRDRR